ncbi:MAG: nitrogenase component 1 [Lentisphaerota bacterium]
MDFSTTRNACKLCTPLGACLAFRGVEGAMPFLHGSQGCATYIRRYVISHFREPIDIASSSFNEASAVFGGGENLNRALDNVRRQYRPQLIGIATTCLSETIGEDVPGLLREYRKARDGQELPELVHVSTPSYRETHSAGFHNTVRALVETLAVKPGEPSGRVVLLPGMVSPSDLRYLKEILSDFGLPLTLLPDYSNTLDAPLWKEYHSLPEGGTPVEDIRRAGGAAAAIQFGHALATRRAAADVLSERFGTPLFKQGWPVGMRATDRFFQTLEQLSGRPTPEAHARERGRLMDALVDGHKYVFGLRAALYGEDDLVLALAEFCAEIGIEPVLCASGGKEGHLKKWLHETTGDATAQARVLEGADFAEISAAVSELNPDLLIGHSKGFTSARAAGAPLIRVGFPIHDRFGAQRIRHLGYRGAQELFDRIVNTVLERRQEASEIGYSYQ